MLTSKKIDGLTVSTHFDGSYNFTPDDCGDSSLYLMADHDQFSVRSKELKNLDALKKTHHIFWLEAYIHSGVALALVEDRASFPGRDWDVSRLGAVVASKTEWKTRAQARKAAQSLVKEWNYILAGQVFGYRIEDEDGNELDACWGFIGDAADCLEQGIEEARAIAKDIRTKKQSALKAKILNYVPLLKR